MTCVPLMPRRAIALALPYRRWRCLRWCCVGFIRPQADKMNCRKQVLPTREQVQPS